MTPWICKQCSEDQIAFGRVPEDRLCCACCEARRAASAFTEADAGIPKLFRGLTRESWSAYFQRPWPEALESWTGDPRWIALWWTYRHRKDRHRHRALGGASAHRPARTMDLRP